MPGSLLPAEGGLLLVDKPAGCTSHDVVGRVRRILRTRRVGHAGTLDPMATGLLVIAVERSTKLLARLQLVGKSYAATIRLGQATTTDDIEGEIISRAGDLGAVTESAITDGIIELTGDVLQRPSSVSAIKVDGRRAYELARSGEQVELALRPVRVDRFEVLGPVRFGADAVELDVEVECSSGTYIRALARDLGDRLGVGGHLTALRRTAVGPFRVAGAIDVYDGLSPAPRGERNPDPTQDLIDRTIAAVLDPVQVARQAFSVRTATAREAVDISFGRALAPIGRSGSYALLSPGEDALLAVLRESGGAAKPEVVFAPAG